VCVESRLSDQETDGQSQDGPIYLTDAELATYDGSDPTKPIYVAVNGTIFDVTAGPT
jgi:hypothetical protein